MRAGGHRSHRVVLPTRLLRWLSARAAYAGKIAAVIDALGGDAGRLVSRVPPRWGSLTREVLAINMVMAGCRPEYAPVVEAAMLALCDTRFNLNGV